MKRLNARKRAFEHNSNVMFQEFFFQLLSEFPLKDRTYSNEAALSLRSRRSGTKFAAPNRTAY